MATYGNKLGKLSLKEAWETKHCEKSRDAPLNKTLPMANLRRKTGAGTTEATSWQTKALKKLQARVLSSLEAGAKLDGNGFENW